MDIINDDSSKMALLLGEAAR